MLFIEDLEGNIFDIVFFIRKNNERACIFLKVNAIIFLTGLLLVVQAKPKLIRDDDFIIWY